jgi:ankyrin repeat protein
MRLLQFDGEGEPSLVEFVGTNPPRYAILSHTWGADGQEITYQDIENRTGRQKDGWQKLQFCKDRAKNDGLQYLWIDTCCIDKSSSAELTEAINSMFSWYRAAERCYVYLSDVCHDTSNGIDDESTRRWKPAFKKSAWFTRGWTLQELIAPASVEFFSRESIYLGSRETLEQTIHEITGVAVEALRGAPLSNFTKDERLSWAAKRKTKRSEDAAYCLLGIFEVFIPPIYGEGRESALSRLEEQIEKASKGGRNQLLREQKELLMESLRFKQIDARQKTIKRAHDETCKWLLNNSQYLNWIDSTKLNEHHGFLWIRGKPGAGKSTLMKFALADTRRTKLDTVVIAFFFNARGDSMEKSTLGMYRALLLQLLERLPTLQSSFESLRIPASRIGVEYQWSLDSLHMLFEEVVQKLGEASVVCFIDALDECEEQQIRDMIAFFEHLGKLSVSASTRLRVCFSSRHYPNITIENGLNLVLEGQEGHAQDIINYIKSKLKIGESQTAHQIRRDLQDKASGVFMWVVLVVDILRKEYDRGRVHALRKRLNEIPANLHELFYDILTRDSRDSDELILCIQWVLFAKEPLSPEQLYFAILSGIEPDTLGRWDSEDITKDSIERFILDASKGLTETTKSKSQTVQFIHESVRDFFLKENGLSNIWPALKDNFEGQSHERLKHCCLTYMSQDSELLMSIPASLLTASSGEVRKLRDSIAGAFPFLLYAVKNILYHADRAQRACVGQQEFMRAFPWIRWVKLDNLFEKDQIRMHTIAVSSLYIFAERNMPNLIRSHPSVSSCFDVISERCGAPFLAAIATRSRESVHEFVDALSGPEAQRAHSHRLYTQYYQNAKGQYLLGPRFEFPEGNMLVSFLVDLGNKAILSLALRAYEFKINTKEYDRSAHLVLAAANGHRDVAGLLSDDSTRSRVARSDQTSTALLMAATNGHEDTVKLLLGSQAIDSTAKDKNGSTPILLAATNGHTKTVELLLQDSIAEVNAEDKKGSTPILLAAKNGHKDTVELLLKTIGIDPDPVNKIGSTPLLLAAASGHKDIVKLLLDTGRVDVNVKDAIELRPLLSAIANGYKDIVKLLLDTGKVDVNVTDRKGYTALVLAILDRREDIVQLLLTSDKIDLNKADSRGNSPLAIATRNGMTNIVELLLATGKVEVDTSNPMRHYSLSLAIEHGFMEGVDVNQREGNRLASFQSMIRENSTDPACMPHEVNEGYGYHDD